MSRRRLGSALILVLWCLILLGMAVFGVVDLVELSVDSTAHDERLMEARALALSGVAVGSVPQLQKDDPLLSQQTAPGHHYKVTIESEGSRLNLNYLLQTDRRDILINLFTQWGLSVADADHVADCLYDWSSSSPMRSLNGAKADDYARADLPQRPTGRPFSTMKEVGQVMGMDMVEKIKPDWQSSFTLWSNGPLNVSEAPADLMAAVFDLDSKRLETFVEMRNGHDGIAGTADDVLVKDAKTFQSDIGLSDDKMKALSNQISFIDSSRRVESVGQANGTQVMISVITRLNTAPPQILLWSEQ